jgi:hypothetical protein
LQAHLRARQFKQKKEPWLAPRGLLSWPTSGREWQPWEGSGSRGGCQAPAVDKGHCTVYTIDRRRFGATGIGMVMDRIWVRLIENPAREKIKSD